MFRSKWEDISKYRGEMFGIAIISVIILHYLGQFNSVAPNRVVHAIAKIYNGAIGSVGVDIFVVLSGYGIFFSLSNSKKLSAFYQKRFKRVMFPYLIWGLLFWIIKDIFLLKETGTQFLYDYTLLSFWEAGVQTFWYIAFICLMYLISPLLFKLTDSGIKTIIGVVALCSVSFICYFISPVYFKKVEIALQRLPSFLIGMYLGMLSKRKANGVQEQEIPRWLGAVLLCSVPVKIALGLMNHPFARMVNGYYAVFLIVAYTMVRNAMKRDGGRFFPWISSIGAYSMELYVAHIAIRNLMGTLGFNMENLLIYIIHVAIVIPLSLFVVQLQKIQMFKER